MLRKLGWLRGVARVGTLCGVLAMLLVFVPGCPPCETDADCDDGLWCNGAETCNVETGRCVAGEDPCEGLLGCDDENDVCIECVTVADCGDEDLCTTDACVDGLCVYTPVDCDDNDACTTDTCTAATGACVHTDVVCDDGDLCTDDDCDPATGCVYTPADCGDEVCDPVTGDCVECVAAADCADDDACTTDACVDNACVYTDVVCDDGDLCTTDTCDAAAGCVFTPVVCPAGQECDATTGDCVPVTECDDDTDCDDLLWCTGEETCDLATGTCVAGTAPCDPDTQECDEDADICIDLVTPCVEDADCNDDDNCTTDACVDEACVFTPVACAAGQECDPDTGECVDIPGETRTFTLLIGESLTGTGNADTFNAPLELNQAGVTLPTLQTGDAADGLDGTDTLALMLNSTADNTVLPTLTSMERLQVTDFTAGLFTTTLNLLNTPDVTDIAVTNTSQVNDADSTIISNIANNASMGLTNVGSDVDLQFQVGATSGSADVATVSVSQTTATAELLITTATTNGFETINLTATGLLRNYLEDLTFVTGTSQRTLNVLGDQALTIIGAVDANLTAIGAGENTGGVALNAAGTGNVTFTGGTGNDVLLMGNSYTTGDTLNGGDGSDVLGMNSAQANVATNQTNVTNFEGLLIQDALANAVNTTYFGSPTTVYQPAGIAGGFATTVASGTNVVFGAFFSGTSQFVANTDTAANGAITVTGLGATDNATLTVNDHDFGAAGNTLTLNGIETLSLVSSGAANGNPADGNVNILGTLTLAPTSGTGSITLTGTAPFQTLGPVSAGVINAVDFGQAFTMALNTAGNTTNSTVAGAGATITGGAGNDVLVGSVNGDTMVPGAGNNTAQPGRGADSVTFTTGTNILDLEDLQAAHLTFANRVLVSAFNADGTTYTAGASVADAIRFDNVSTNEDLSDGCAAAGFLAVATAGSINLNTLAGGTTAGILELAWEFSPAVNLGAGGANEQNGTTLLSALGAASGTTAGTLTAAADDDAIVIIAYQGGNAYFYFADEGNGGNTTYDAAEIALFAVFSNVSVGGFDRTQFID